MEEENFHSSHRERLRRRYLNEGADTFEDHALLELFLFDAMPRCDTNPLSHRLIDKFGSLDGVMRASFDELMAVEGIGTKTAEYITDAWAKKCECAEKQLRKKPLVTFERASNYLLWHRFRSDKGSVTAVYLDEKMFIKRVVDVESADKLIISPHKSEKNVIVCADSAEGIAEKIHGGIKLLDIISVDGYSVKSLIH